MKKRRMKRISVIVCVGLLLLGIGSQVRFSSVETHTKEQQQLQEEQQLLEQDFLMADSIDSKATKETQIPENLNDENATKSSSLEERKTSNKAEKKQLEQKKKLKKDNDLKDKEIPKTEVRTDSTEKSSNKASSSDKNNKTSLQTTGKDSKKSTADTKSPKATKKIATTSKPTTTKKTATTSKPNTTKKPASTPKTEQKILTCNVEIDCQALLSNLDQVEENMKDYIPKSGYLLKKTSMVVEEGASAYDCLEKACKKNGIALDADYTPIYSGYYVKGIGYLYEKMAGKMSGWLYQVNGTTPNVGASGYKLKEGDVIKWIYTCSGRVGS